jgi:hypothetical protein
MASDVRTGGLVMLMLIMLPAAVAAQVRTAVEMTPTIDVLPPRMLSTAVSAVDRYSAGSRSEFETTQAYRSRAAAKLDSAYIAVPVTSETPECAPFELVYNADRGRMTISLSALWAPFRVSCRWTEVGSYVGTNALGGQRPVSTATEHAVFIRPSARAAVTLGHTAAWRIPADQAQILKPHMALAIVFRPGLSANGLIVEEVADRWKPTFDHPLDVTLKATVIYADDIQLWVYDRRNGAVMNKMNARLEFGPGMRD